MSGHAFPYYGETKYGETKKLMELCPAIGILWNHHPHVPLSADKKKGDDYFFFTINRIITARSRDNTIPVTR